MTQQNFQQAVTIRIGARRLLVVPQSFGMGVPRQFVTRNRDRGALDRDGFPSARYADHASRI